MPRQKNTRLVEGSVRFLGLAKTLKVSGPSGAVYVFHRGEVAAVQIEDWDWIARISDNRTRFELLEGPGEPAVVPVEAPAVVEAPVEPPVTVEAPVEAPAVVEPVVAVNPPVEAAQPAESPSVSADVASAPTDEKS